uniref:Zinc finger protein n=1 Tax=Sipha flava TaxID=143950 RepID=A0A2S2QHJ0_9HEMI
MFNCEQCAITFTRKYNFIAHQKKHAGVRFPCTICSSSFSYKTGLSKHMKNIHGIVNLLHRLLINPLDRVSYSLRLVLSVMLTKVIYRSHLKFLFPISRLADRMSYPRVIYVLLQWTNMRNMTLLQLTGNAFPPRIPRRLLEQRK